jgi:hypothetical protein
VTVSTDQRAVVVAIRLRDAGRKQLKWLYRGLEEGAELDLHQQLDRHYDEVEVVSGDECTPEALVQRVLAAAARDDLTTLDVITVVHGAPGELDFAKDLSIKASDLAHRLASAGAGPKLRLLYSTACYGQSHAAPLVAAGFSTVIGSKGKNTNGLSEFRKLLTQWTEGKTVQEAVHRADRPIPRMFWDLVARLNGFRQVDSQKVVTGDPMITISSDP